MKNTRQTEVSAAGNAEFYGIFFGMWWAYPEVNAFVNCTVSWYIHNTIILTFPYYSSSTLFNQDFTGSVTVVQCIL
ncbi:hypothetical protein B9Q04_16770 [Candidatus Marsarchaeota G2 archaeon BE_D]|uniref:Uncharacterized protein n=1 Tax=Candidatus Marsarchaeota G2 archaeon BE_D TaxID=1978158 RepID=A0A2R6C617_9ARCH|nr:MAG: hypothetical protein B9Q04_16770 [Candidatus Marsarchaeota G2 archaeon BE_D]